MKRRTLFSSVLGAAALLSSASSSAAPLSFQAFISPSPVDNSVPGFVRVHAGQFMMGSPMSEAPSRLNDEVQHSVTLTKDFLIAKYDVTVGEFREFVLATGYLTEAEKKGDGWVVIDSIEQPKADASWRKPYFAQTDLDPVVLVTWNDAITYCNWRSSKEGLRPAYIIKGSDVQMERKAKGYRLPTEAEWEYAARGGAEGAKHYTKYAGSDNFDEVAWCSRNSGNRTHPVGQKAPNVLELYDMSGNVDQWCWDLYGAYPSNPQTDPVGGTAGIWRVHRGGSWLASPGQYVRIAYRYIFKTETRTTIGFRLVRNP